MSPLFTAITLYGTRLLFIFPVLSLRYRGLLYLKALSIINDLLFSGLRHDEPASQTQHGRIDEATHASCNLARTLLASTLLSCIFHQDRLESHQQMDKLSGLVVSLPAVNCCDSISP